MRGHGDSGWHPEGAYMVEDYTSDIEALVKELNLRDIVFWGNSTGGRVAQMMAGLHPGLVAAAVVEDVGPERPESISKGRAARMGEEDKGWAGPTICWPGSKTPIRAPLTRYFPTSSNTEAAVVTTDASVEARPAF